MGIKATLLEDIQCLVAAKELSDVEAPRPYQVSRGKDTSVLYFTQDYLDCRKGDTVWIYNTSIKFNTPKCFYSVAYDPVVSSHRAYMNAFGLGMSSFVGLVLCILVLRWIIVRVRK